MLPINKTIWIQSSNDYEIDLHIQEKIIIRERKETLANHNNSTFPAIGSAYLPFR